MKCSFTSRNAELRYKLETRSCGYERRDRFEIEVRMQRTAMKRDTGMESVYSKKTIYGSCRSFRSESVRYNKVIFMICAAQWLSERETLRVGFASAYLVSYIVTGSTSTVLP